MKVLLSGSNGYLGSEIKNYYLDNGYEVVTIGKSVNNDIVIDFKNIEIEEILDQLTDVDTIFHCAAVNEVNINDSIFTTYNVNVTFTRYLVEIAKKIGVKWFYYVSTFHVYGMSNGKITERTKISPLNDYGLTHFLSEEIIRHSSEGASFEYLILRPTNLYGVPSNFSEFNRWTLVPFMFIREAWEKGSITINSSGLQYRNFVSISDLIGSLKLMGEEKCINVYGEISISIYDFAVLISNILLKKFGKNILIDVKRKNGNETARLTLDVSNSCYSKYKPMENQLENFVLNMIAMRDKWKS